MNRREHLKSMLALGAAAMLAPTGMFAGQALGQAAPPPVVPPPPPPAGPFKLPPLGYAFDALEPHVDAQTMQIHHGKHHQAYVNNVNALVPKYEDLAKKPIEEILANLDAVPEAVRAGIRNNLGGHWNHTFFWDLMTPGGAKAPTGKLLGAINDSFGGVDKMVDEVNAAATKQFGSGWAWLTVMDSGKLHVVATANQDTPLATGHKGAILGVDVWEHAYYLKYQNRRADYLKAWWNVVNWDKAAANFDKLSSKK